MKAENGDIGMVPVSYVEKVPSESDVPPPPERSSFKHKPSVRKSVRIQASNASSSSGKLAAGAPPDAGVPVGKWTESNVIGWILAQGTLLQSCF